MNDKKYSVDEIDAMREAVDWLVRRADGIDRDGMFEDGLHIADHSKVEGRLRTYMLNGTRPDELQECVAILHDRDASDQKSGG